MAGGIGDVAQGPLPGEYCQPVHRGPDGVFDAVAAPPVEHAGIGQLVERGAQMTQGRALLPGPAVRSVVGVLLRYRERADLVQALWRHHGVRRTVVVTFDYTSLALLELLRRQLEGTMATPAITAALMINGGLFADAHTHPWTGVHLSYR
jgi:hypothetical protein